MKTLKLVAWNVRSLNAFFYCFDSYSAWARVTFRSLMPGWVYGILLLRAQLCDPLWVRVQTTNQQKDSTKIGLGIEVHWLISLYTFHLDGGAKTSVDENTKWTKESNSDICKDLAKPSLLPWSKELEILKGCSVRSSQGMDVQVENSWIFSLSPISFSTFVASRNQKWSWKWIL